VLELFLEIIFEGLLQLGSQLLVELGYRGLAETIAPRQDRNPILAGFGYALLGLIVGGLSLFIFPEAIARGERFHGINVLVAPALAGLGMAGLGWLLERSGRRRLRIDSFAYGFIFALPMSLVRFYFTD
jgi:hypothetical protein